MKLRPLGDRIVVKRDDPKDKSKGGILLPQSAQAREKPKKGTVVAVGPGLKENGDLVPMSLKVGQHVLFASYAGHDFDEEDERYVVMSESDVLGVIE